MKQKTIVNIAKDTPDRLPRYRYFYRNDVYLYRREGLQGWLWLIAKDIWHCVQVLLFAPSEKANRLKIIVGGFKTGVCFHPAIDMLVQEDQIWDGAETGR